MSDRCDYCGNGIDYAERNDLAARTARAVNMTTDHRLCGRPYAGCYSHWPMAHCRACGMAWPCDVDRIRATLETGE